MLLLLLLLLCALPLSMLLAHTLAAVISNGAMWRSSHPFCFSSAECKQIQQPSPAHRKPCGVCVSVWVCVFSHNEAHHSTLRRCTVIDGSLTTKSTCISYFRDVFGRNNLARSSRQLFRESADADAWTDTHTRARALTHAVKLSAWGRLLFYYILTFRDRCKSHEVLVSERGTQREKKNMLKACSGWLRKTIHSGPQEQDPSVGMYLSSPH